MALLSLELCSMDKASLIAKVRDRHDAFGALLMELADARDCRRGLTHTGLTFVSVSRHMAEL
jgi:hypothetical protein